MIGGGKGGSKPNLPSDQFPMNRQKPNTGPFAKLKEPMTMEHVKMVSDDAEIGYEGIKINIIDDPSMIRYPYTGYTHPGGQTVDLYPNAFINRENLGHERIHVMQKFIYGEASDANMLKLFEDAAYSSESSWWEFYKKVTGGR